MITVMKNSMRKKELLVKCSKKIKSVIRKFNRVCRHNLKRILILKSVKFQNGWNKSNFEIQKWIDIKEHEFNSVPKALVKILLIISIFCYF